MKVFYALVAAVTGSVLFSCSHQGDSCCNSGETFASLASQASFAAAHAEPVPAAFSLHGKMISFPTADGGKANGYLVASKKKSTDYLFVFHEWWGLNDHVKDMADRLHDSLPGVNILALDLFDGKVATTRDEAGKLSQGNDQRRSHAIIRGALEYSGKEARIGTIGWCFGGGWSTQAAIDGGKQTVACVNYYGMPEDDVNRLKTLNSDVVFIFAKRDEWINEEVKKQFIENMKTAGKTLVVEEYDAVHAFANPSNPNYDPQASAAALNVSVKYLRNRFGR